MGSTHLKDLPQDRHDEVHRLNAEEDAQRGTILRIFQNAVTPASLSQIQPGSPSLAPAERSQNKREKEERGQFSAKRERDRERGLYRECR